MPKHLDDIDVKGKRILVRADYNVTEEHGVITDDYRVRATIPTIQALKERGARAILLFSHMGRPDGYDEQFSLAPVAVDLTALLGEPVNFVSDCVGDVAEAAAAQAEGGAVLLFENLRFHPGETGNDAAFAEQLAKLGDVLVMEAFGAVHRAHASTVLLPKLLPAAAGPMLSREIQTLTRVRETPKQPYVAVVGGAKISTKLPLIRSLLEHVEGLCLGGALANTVLKAKGLAIGRSIVEEEMIEELKDVELTDTRLHIPIDVVVSKSIDGTDPVRETGVGDVQDDEFILDIGPETQQLFRSIIEKAATVFWNGPMGLAEIEAFRWGTVAVAGAVAHSPGYSVVGGGDSTIYLQKLRLEEEIGFISTGGGAMLEFLAGNELPGLKALEA